MPLQLLEIGFHVEIHAIEWHDFEHETQFHGVVVAWIEFSTNTMHIENIESMAYGLSYQIRVYLAPNLHEERHPRQNKNDLQSKGLKRVPQPQQELKYERWGSSNFALHMHGCCLLPLVLSDATHIIKNKNCYVETNISLQKLFGACLWIR